MNRRAAMAAPPRIGAAVTIAPMPAEVEDAAAAEDAPLASEAATDEAAEAAEEAREEAPLASEPEMDDAAEAADDSAEDRAEAADPEIEDRAEAADPEMEDASEAADEAADSAAPERVLKTVDRPVVTVAPETTPTRGMVVMAVTDGAVAAVAPVAADAAADAALERMVRAEPPETEAVARRFLQYSSPKAMTLAASVASQASLAQSRTP